MTVRVYTSTDALAPVLSGTVGSLLTLLDAVLVNGYGVNPAAGWTKHITDTNKGVYKSGGMNGRYYRVIDDGVTTGLSDARYALIRGFGSMTDVDTGSDPFPTVAQKTYGMVICKSDTATTVARDWTIIADEHTCYLLVDTTNYVTTTGRGLTTFGKMFSYKPSDVWNDFICAGAGTSPTSRYWMGGSYLVGRKNPANEAYQQLYIARNYTQNGTSERSTVFIDLSKTGLTSVSFIGTEGMSYPNPVDGGLYVSKLFIHENGVGLPLRGYLRGLYCPLHARPLSDGDVYTGVGPMAGKTFMVFKIYAGAEGVGASPSGQIHIEISDTWGGLS